MYVYKILAVSPLLIGLFLVEGIDRSERGATGADASEGDKERTTVPVPIEGMTVSAESVALRGSRLVARGNVRLELADPAGLTILAERVEYTLGAHEVIVRGPRWALPGGDEAVPRVSASGREATFDTKRRAWTCDEIEIEEGRTRLLARAARYDPREKRLSLEGITGRYRSGGAVPPGRAVEATRDDPAQEYALRARDGAFDLTENFALGSAVIRDLEVRSADGLRTAAAATAEIDFGDGDGAESRAVRLRDVVIRSAEGALESSECTLRLAR